MSNLKERPKKVEKKTVAHQKAVKDIKKPSSSANLPSKATVQRSKTSSNWEKFVQQTGNATKVTKKPTTITKSTNVNNKKVSKRIL